MYKGSQAFLVQTLMCDWVGMGWKFLSIGTANDNNPFDREAKYGTSIQNQRGVKG